MKNMVIGVYYNKRSGEFCLIGITDDNFVEPLLWFNENGATRCGLAGSGNLIVDENFEQRFVALTKFSVEDRFLDRLKGGQGKDLEKEILRKKKEYYAQIQIEE